MRFNFGKFGEIDVNVDWFDFFKSYSKDDFEQTSVILPENISRYTLKQFELFQTKPLETLISNIRAGEFYVTNLVLLLDYFLINIDVIDFCKCVYFNKNNEHEFVLFSIKDNSKLKYKNNEKVDMFKCDQRYMLVREVTDTASLKVKLEDAANKIKVLVLLGLAIQEKEDEVYLSNTLLKQNNFNTDSLFKYKKHVHHQIVNEINITKNALGYTLNQTGLPLKETSSFNVALE